MRLQRDRQDSQPTRKQSDHAPRRSSPTCSTRRPAAGGAGAARPPRPPATRSTPRAVHAERSPESTREPDARLAGPGRRRAGAGRGDGGHRLHARDRGRRAPAAADRGADADAAGRGRGRASSSSRASPARSTTTRSGSSTAATPRPCSTRCSAAPCTPPCPAGVGYTTAGLEVKFVRPITREVERVRADGEVLYRGRRQATAQARLHRRRHGQAARPRHRAPA